ncbi:MAG: carbohydrate binding family 9 domain-containing protein [candidate division KSB1 bacterium]|nr:carbohydrate binding family 9 domain-containing protein [candidate division KSB1 bacterium]
MRKFVPRVTVLLGIVMVLVGGPAASEQRQEESTSPRIAQAVRIEGGKVRIDGRLDESVWQLAPVASDFVQHEPDEGAPATERTTFQVAYDNEHLYVAVRAFDSEPGKVRGLLTRRDVESPSDWIFIAVDSYGDHRTAFQFGVNPAGTRSDVYRSGDVNEDTSWDAVWDVAVSRDSLGWVAEFCIPFSQLRFPQGHHRWGFQVGRIISRKNELDLWAPIPRNANSVVALFGELQGIHDVPPPRRMQVLPYAVGRLERYLPDEPNPFFTPSRRVGTLGGDIKYGVTSNLTLDLTVNPDFGEVEADPSEFNLTAYESYFEEKRPFFLEGNDIFRFGVGIGDGEMGNETLFYSRRIGRAPQLSPDVSEEGYVDMPRLTTILFAGKVTGKSKHGWSIGFLEALADREVAQVEDQGRRFTETVEPRTNYLVFRTQKDFRKGRTTLGTMVTSVTRHLDAPSVQCLNRQAFTGGIDFGHRWSRDRFMLELKLAASQIRGSQEAIAEAQTSSARYFQRPDAPHVRFDSTRTTLSGVAFSYLVGKMAGGNWSYGAGGVVRSPGFEVNDLGYQREADFVVNFAFLGYHWFQPGKVLRDYGMNLNLWHVTNFGGEALGLGGSANYHFRLLNYWGGHLGCSVHSAHLSPSSLRGGPAIMVPEEFGIFARFFTDERKAIAASLSIMWEGDEHGSRELRIMPSVTLRPSGRMQAQLSVGIVPAVDDRQYVDTITRGECTDYVFGRLTQKTVFLTTRLSYTFTPTLSLQYYGMPFLTAGAYSHFRKVIAPRAADYAQRYAPYEYPDNPNFNFRQFRSNLLLRWEYRPGSTLFLVWSQGRTSLDDEGTFSLLREGRALFDTRSENVFLVKVNRWLSL